MLVTFGEKLLGPTKHVLERAFTKVDSVAIHLETEKGLAILHPGDLASRATWILAVNSCFHKHAVRWARSCAGTVVVARRQEAPHCPASVTQDGSARARPH